MPIVSKNPYTLEVIKTYEELTDKEVQEKISISKNAFDSWKQISIQERAKYFDKLIEVLKSERENLAKLNSQEMGKPITGARAEIDKCMMNAKFFSENAEKFLENDKIETEAQESYVRFDPMGTILFVMPWNFPFWQCLRQAIPVIIAGNTVLLKHASNVPGSALAIQEIFEKAGFPKGVFQTLLIGSSKVESVIADFRVKAVSLTGSEGAGSAVAAVAGKYLKKCVMELGGSDPFIIFSDANLDVAAQVCSLARLNNSGQVCNSPKRVIIMRDVADEYIEKLKAIYENQIIGDPMDEKTQIGPLAMGSILGDVEKQVRKSVDLGAKVICGAERPLEKGYFYYPTILILNPEVSAKEISKTEMPAYHEEIFGPVTSVIIVDSEEEAIEIANDTVYGLGASIWSQDIERVKKYLPQIHAGAVYINQKVTSDPRMPIGGVNYSGFGRELSRYGLLEFVNIKAVSILEV